MTDTRIDEIEEAAKGPRRVQVDDTSVESTPIPDQIELDRYKRAQESAASAGLGIKRTPTAPPGAA